MRVVSSGLTMVTKVRIIENHELVYYIKFVFSEK